MTDKIPRIALSALGMHKKAAIHFVKNRYLIKNVPRRKALLII